MPITPADSLDLLIAHGPPDATDFAKQIAGLPGAYYAGLDEAYKRRQQDAFQNGVPTITVIGPDGKPTQAPDYNAAGVTALKMGGVPAVAPFATLAGLDINRQNVAADLNSARERAGYPVPGAPPATGTTTPPGNTVTAPPAPRIPSDGTGQSITGLVSPTDFGDQTDRVANAVAKRFKVDQTQQLSPQQVAEIQQFVAQVPRPPQRQPAVAPVATDNAPITRPPVAANPVIDPNSPVPAFWQAKGANGVNEYLARLRLRSGMGTKEGREQTEKTIKAVEDWQEKNSGIERSARTKEGEELSKTLKEFVEGGIDARGHDAQLEEIRRLGQRVPYGIIPKVQSFLGHYGIETKGLSDIQAYERAIDFFSPQLRPIGSGRLLQNELTAFKSALGGLMTTPEGRELSISNLQILSKYKEDVGRVAADKSLTGDQRINKIYDLKIPKLQTELPKAPAQGTQAVKTQPVFKTQSDADAAVARGQLRRGDTFIAGDGKIRKVP